MSCALQVIDSCMLSYLAQRMKKFVSTDLQFGWIYLVFSLLLFGSFFHHLVRNMFKQHLTSTANLQKRKKFNTEASPRHRSFYLITACIRRALQEPYFLNDKGQMKKRRHKITAHQEDSLIIFIPSTETKNAEPGRER